MDFGALPPEVNSGRMYCGPGSAPMVAAASAWNGLAAELSVAAVGYERVITTLQTEEWLGPASTLMVEAVAPYVAWMRATAIQAEQAASQARAAAAAYETAFAAIVPPPLIAANRARLTSLVTHNVFGQNTASIAATEAQYAEMWAQDAMAMYGYAGSSATATKVTPFAPPPNTTSPSARDAVVRSRQSRRHLSRRGAERNSGADRPLAQHAAGPHLAPVVRVDRRRDPGVAGMVHQLVSADITAVLQHRGFAIFRHWYWQQPYYIVAGAGMDRSRGRRSCRRGAGAVGAAVGGTGPVSAGLGNAATIGKLSVPPNWAGASPSLAPTVGSASAPLVSDIVEQPEAGAAGNLLGGMPLAGSGTGTGGAGPRYGFRVTVMSRPPFAG